MSRQSVYSIERTIAYIEEHLDGKLDLDTVACAMNYSKYHLHRTFTGPVGMTIHDYIFRRQLTEAAKQKIVENAYEPAYGARPLRRYIQKNVETLLAKKILADEIHAGETFVIDEEML